MALRFLVSEECVPWSFSSSFYSYWIYDIQMHMILAVKLLINWLYMSGAKSSCPDFDESMSCRACIAGGSYLIN